MLNLIRYHPHLFTYRAAIAATHKMKKSIPAVSPAINPVLDSGSAESRKQRKVE